MNYFKTMMEKSLIAFLVGVFVSFGVKAQTELNTDRPGQSINPNTVGDRILQFQSGYGYFRSKAIFSEIDLHNVDLVPKLGMGKRLEISGLIQYSALNVERTFINEDDPDWDNGISSLGMAMRGTLLRGEGLKPTIGLDVGYIASGLPGDELTSSTGRFILTFQNEIINRLSFTGNVVYFTNNQTEFTANLSYIILDEFGVFVEYWPVFEAVFDGEENLRFLDAYLNTGGFWSIGDSWQLDALVGFRAFAPDFYSDDESSYYLQVGFTKRFWLKD